MMPFSGDAGTSGDVDDSLGYRLQEWVDSAVANDIIGSDIRDRLLHVGRYER